jgi:hypothetical protein
MATQFAVIFDFDDTLADDSTAALVNHYKTPALLRHYEQKLREEYDNDQSRVAQCFYDETTEMISSGWDPPLAYTTLLLDKMREGQIAHLRKDDLKAFGKDHVVIYPGVDNFLVELRDKFENDAIISREHFSLDYYVVSGGIADIIKGTPIAHHFKEIWACEIQYDSDGYAVRPKSVISFTEKTKYLFCINKGIDRDQNYETPYAVNVDVPEEDRPVPLAHMIYVGDGASDIPCMSVLKKSKGESFLLYGPRTVHKAWEIGDRGHPWPRDYENWTKDYMISGVIKHAQNIAKARTKRRDERLSGDVGYSGKKTQRKKTKK